MSVAGFKVAGQAVDGGKGTRLGMYISVGEGAFINAELQCTVSAAGGLCLIKFLENIRTRVGISQERNQEFR